MKLEVLLSCMHQNDDHLISRSGLTGNVLMVNQCQEDHHTQHPTKNGTANIYCTRERGLTKSRNFALSRSTGDICLLCDDDETFVPDYEKRILDAYALIPQADVLVFKMSNRPPSFPDRILRLRFPLTLRVSSWQISFRRDALLQKQIRFDELLGAGTGNGGEEELKFLTDCERAGLKIYYIPVEIAAVAQEESTWFSGFNETFFENRGATTRYILGPFKASLYAVYYLLSKRRLYISSISTKRASQSIFNGILGNRIGKQAALLKENEAVVSTSQRNLL